MVETWEATWTRAVTSILNRKLLVLVILAVTILPAAASQITSNYDGSIQMPDWNNQREMVQGYVAPFIFVYIILYFAFTKTFHFILRDQETHVWEEGPDASTEAMVLSVAVTLMMMVTPFWDYIQLSMKFLGVLGVFGFVLGFLAVIYLMAR